MLRCPKVGTAGVWLVLAIGPGCRPEFVEVHAGSSYGLALTADGEARTMGRLPGFMGSQRVHCREGHYSRLARRDNTVCGLTGDALVCWDGRSSGSDHPYEERKALHTKTVFMGALMDCGVDTDGRVQALDWNGDPVDLDLPDRTWSEVACGGDSSTYCAWDDDDCTYEWDTVQACGLDTDGDVVCSGGEEPLGDGPFSSLSHAEVDVVCALDGDGHPHCAAWNPYSGSLTPNPGWEPIGDVPGGPFDQISQDGATFCGVTPAGTIHCEPFFTGAFAFVEPPSSDGWVQVSVEVEMLCAVDDRGRADCWGDDVSGRWVCKD